MAEREPEMTAAVHYAALMPATISNTGHPGYFFPRHCGEIESGDHAN